MRFGTTAFALAISLAPRLTRAQSQPDVSVVYRVTPPHPRCSTERAFLERLAERSGVDARDARDGAVIAVSITVNGARRRFNAHLEWRPRRGAEPVTRALSDARCARLVERVIVAINTWLAPSRGAPTLPPPSSPPAPTPPTPTPPPPALPPMPVVVLATTPGLTPVERPPSPSPLRLRVVAGAHGAWGVTAGLGFGASLAVGLRWRAFSVTAEGRHDIAERVERANEALSISMSGGALAPCLHAGVGLLCAVVAVGALRTEAVGFALDRSDLRLFSAIGVRGGAEIPFGRRLALRTHAEVLAQLQSVEVRANGTVFWSSEPVAIAVSVGLLVDLL